MISLASPDAPTARGGPLSAATDMVCCVEDEAAAVSTCGEREARDHDR